MRLVPSTVVEFGPSADAGSPMRIVAPSAKRKPSAAQQLRDSRAWACVWATARRSIEEHGSARRPGIRAPAAKRARALGSIDFPRLPC
jgi:hypothetical protein